jgi:hypothetical protein
MHEQYRPPTQKRAHTQNKLVDVATEHGQNDAVEGNDYEIAIGLAVLDLCEEKWQCEIDRKMLLAGHEHLQDPYKDNQWHYDQV